MRFSLNALKWYRLAYLNVVFIEYLFIINPCSCGSFKTSGFWNYALIANLFERLLLCFIDLVLFTEAAIFQAVLLGYKSFMRGIVAESAFR